MLIFDRYEQKLIFPDSFQYTTQNQIRFYACLTVHHQQKVKKKAN